MRDIHSPCHAEPQSHAGVVEARRNGGSGHRLGLIRLALAGALLAGGWRAAAARAAEAASAQSAPSADTNSAFNGALPPSADLRPEFEKFVLARRQQGGRGTCSAFVMAGALEYALAQKQQRGSRLSVEFLNWAANKVVGRTNDGGYFSDLWDGFAAHGVCAEEDLPYQKEFNPGLMPAEDCMERAKAVRGLGLRLHWIKEWNPNVGLTDKQLAKVKRTLSRGWPVCGGFLWPKQEKWEGGVLQMCAREGVRDGHSVLLVGYRDEAGQPGGGVFIFRNTSGEGRDGAMSYTYAHSYMNDAAWVGYGPEASPDEPVFRNVLGALARLPAGRNRRISSNQQPEWNNSNMDMTVLTPGKVFELPILDGPGVITHIWLTSHAGWANELNALSLRIYWDGRSEPGVEAPLGEFFAVGQGRPAVVESLPVQVSPSGALSCYWRMPFAESARVVVANDNPDRTAGLYWQVDWVELDDLPADTPYFHAQYRQEYPAKAGSDYLIADLAGRGQYVGTVMSVTLAQDGWWGEGDDFFYIDGEPAPSLQGTGCEDYFNDAWGFRPRTSHWFGQPRWQGDNAGDSGVCYRWHVLDPVGFARSLKVTLEHKGNCAEDTDGFYLERPDFINSVAFWYQTGEPKRYGYLPPYPERRVPWQHHHLVRAFRQAWTTGPAKVQVRTTGLFGARPVLGWPNTMVGTRLSLPFTVEQAGRYAVRLTAAGAPDHGVYDVQLDGKTVLAAADFHAPEEQELDLLLGSRELSAGAHVLSFRAVKTGATGAKPMAVEMLRLLRLPPESRRAVKTDNEAHFIRLGIGRAVYAYRLAYGTLPDSLETLVKVNIMPRRYLTDENNQPLRSGREGDFFVIESTGPVGWKHRWQGLDARR